MINGFVGLDNPLVRLYSDYAMSRFKCISASDLKGGEVLRWDKRWMHVERVESKLYGNVSVYFEDGTDIVVVGSSQLAYRKGMP